MENVLSNEAGDWAVEHWQKAGLQCGDVVGQDVGIHPLASSFNAPMRLVVHREGAEKLVVYDPHAGSLDGMAWELDEQHCNTQDR